MTKDKFQILALEIPEDQAEVPLADLWKNKAHPKQIIKFKVELIREKHVIFEEDSVLEESPSVAQE